MKKLLHAVAYSHISSLKKKKNLRLSLFLCHLSCSLQLYQLFKELFDLHYENWHAKSAIFAFLVKFRKFLVLLHCRCHVIS